MLEQTCLFSMVANVPEAMSGNVPLLNVCNPYARVLPFTNVKRASPSHARSVNRSGPRMLPSCPLPKSLVELEVVVQEVTIPRAVLVEDSKLPCIVMIHLLCRVGYRLPVPVALAPLHRPL